MALVSPDNDFLSIHSEYNGKVSDNEPSGRHKKMKSCCLCSTLASPATRPVWDTPVHESSNFVALPSLGSLVEGWLLLVPREHYISMGALPVGLVPEMEEMKTQLGEQVRSGFGEVCVFEHGPAFASRKVGCSVDHAHLHIVPLTFDIEEAARPFMPHDSEWSRASWNECREAHLAGRDYLYFEQPLGLGCISTHSDFGSQVFRKAIASQIGRPDDYNWREFPELDKVAATINVFDHAANSPEGTACAR
jgi:ATP adenylyltransferase